MPIDFKSTKNRIALAEIVRSVSLDTGKPVLAIVKEAVTGPPAESSLVGNFRRGKLRQFAYVEVLVWLRDKYPDAAATFERSIAPPSQAGGVGPAQSSPISFDENEIQQAELEQDIARVQHGAFVQTGSSLAAFFYGPFWRREQHMLDGWQHGATGLRGTIRIVRNDFESRMSSLAIIHSLRLAPGKPYMIALEFAIREPRRGERTRKLSGLRSGWAFPLADGTIHRLLVNRETPQERTFDLLSAPLAGENVPKPLRGLALKEVRAIRRSFVNLQVETAAQLRGEMKLVTAGDEYGQPHLLDYAVISDEIGWLQEEYEYIENLTFDMWI